MSKASQLSFSTATSLIGGALGSIPYQNATSATLFVSIGAAGTVLTSSGTTPIWAPAGGTTVGTSTQVTTVSRAFNGEHHLAFVDSNNAAATAESVYTTSSFTINPFTGNIQIGMTHNDYQPASGGNHTIRLNALNTSSIGFHDSGSTIANIKFSGAYGFEIGAFDGLYGPHNTILHGNVGIGTVSPNAKLEVYRIPATNATAQQMLIINTDFGSATTTGFGGSIVFRGRTPGNLLQDNAQILAYNEDTGDNGYALGFFTTPNNAGGLTRRLTILRGGNVGIGTASPASILHVRNGSLFPQGKRGGASSAFFFENATVTDLYLELANTVTNYSGLLFSRAGTGNYGLINYNNATDNMVFYTSGTVKATLVSTGALAFGASQTAYGTAGQILQSNGNAPPTWVSVSGTTVGTSTQITTVLQTANASYFPTFVDSNNAAAAAESVYTTSSFVINPATGLVTIAKTATIGTTVAQGDPSATDITANSTLLLSGVGGNYLSFGQKASNLAQWIQSGYSNPTTAVYPISLNPLGGNVGIGTLTPSGKLHLYQTAGGSNILTLDTNFASGNAYAINPFITGISNGGFSIRDVTNSAERIVIQATTGNVGIGTTNPGYPLTVQTNGTSVSPSPSGSNIALRLQSTQTNYAVTLQFSDTLTNAAAITMQGGGFRFTTANPGAVQAMSISSGGNVSIGTTSTTNKFEVAGNAGQLFSVSDSFTGTIFSANDVSGIPSIEVLDTGLVKLAQYNGAVTISTGTVSSSTAKLSVYGMLYTSGPQGEIRASNEITAYFSSDARLKENIKLIENPITIIDQIRGVTFDWTDEHMARRGGEDGYFVRKHDIGVIAQEVQAVLPELVGTREDGYLAVKYEKMVPLLIEAIKSQQKTIDTLTSEIKEIKEFLSSLKNN